ncbi:MAG: hypothetical protein NZL88_11010, partial [Gaiellaceae bacterium]|nr:hypothetical protein [Gaiellaceae bacterium]
AFAKAMRSLALRTATIAVGLLALALSIGPRASAHHVDSMRPTSTYSAPCARLTTFCQTDNSTLTYFSESSLNPTSKGTVTSVLVTQFDPTDLDVRWEAPPAYTGSAETDIIYQVNPSVLPPGVSGWTYCDDPISSTRCDQHYVVFGSDFWAQTVTCHETGHAVGLTHGEQAAPPLSNTDPSLACMVSAGSNVLGLGAHNRSEVNGAY